MVVKISSEAVQFVSHFNHEELRDVRVYLDSTDCQDDLRELYIEQGSLTQMDLAILDAIKEKNNDIRIQIIVRIEQVLEGEKAA